MLRLSPQLERRDTRAYRSWKFALLLERPVCEHCNAARSRIVSHIKQPLFGGGLMDRLNVLALCPRCDREFSRSNPVLRRRPTKDRKQWVKLQHLS